MTRLNVSLTNPDADLALTQAKIQADSLLLVDDVFKSNSLSSRLTEATYQSRGLDLISHSHAGILHFRSWILDVNDGACVSLRRSWPAGTPTDIHLLGCNTGHTEAAVAAMRYQASVFGIHVLGTNVPIFANDFGPQGFTSDGTLVPVRHLLTPGSLSGALIDEWFRRFIPYTIHTVPEIINDLEQAPTRELRASLAGQRNTWPVRAFDSTVKRLFQYLVPEAATAPGLLALPESEALLEVGAGMSTRVSLLFGGTFVRVYTNAEPRGILFRGRGAVQLAGGTRV